MPAQSRYAESVTTPWMPTKSLHAAPGQALILFAAALSLLIALGVIGADVAAQRRSVSAANRAVEQAAIAGLRAIEMDSLTRGQPRLRSAEAEAAARALLHQRLDVIRSVMIPSPAAAAQQAEVRIIAPGETCWDGPPAEGAMVCVRLTYQIRSVLGGARTYVATARAEWTPRP